MSDQEVFRSVALQFLIGAMLGAFFMTLLLALNFKNFTVFLLSTTSPTAATAIVVTSASPYFAFGAALTGFHFLIFDDHPKGRR